MMRCHAVISPVPRLLASLLLACLACSATGQLHGQTVTYTGTPPALNFGSVNVCPSGATSPAPCSATLTLTYNVTASGTLGTPKVVTVGAPNLDYTLASGSTCIGAVAQGSTCAVNVTLAPRYAGQRKGAVQIVDGSGKVLATTLIYGIGVAPQIAFDPATQTTFGAAPFNSGFVPPAVDESGDIYVSDVYYGHIVKYPSDGSAPTMINTPDGFNPTAIVLDGAADIFSEFANGVYEIPAGGGAAIPLSFPGIYLVDEVAVDGSGDIFLLYPDYLNGQESYAVAEAPAGGGPLIAFPFAPPSSSYAEALTVDTVGNVFVSDVLNNGQGPARVYKLPAGGGGDPVLLPFSTVGASQLTIDAAGDLFVDSLPQIMQVPAGASAPITITDFPSVKNVNFQNGTVSSAGDIFAISPTTDLVEVHRSQPPSVTFPETALGTPSNPLSVQIQNIGNAALSLGGLSASGPFAVVPGPGTPTDCTAGSSLAPGAQCNLSIVFTPESESVLTGSLTVSDNSLNNNQATQVIQLSGTLGQPPQAQLSATTLRFGHIAYPDGQTLPLKITNIGGGTLTVAPSINGPSYTIAGTTCGAGVTAGNSCTLQLKYAPVAIGYHDDILTIATNGSTNNGPTAPTVALQALATGVGALETESPFNFGTVPLGDTEVLPLTIYNYGVGGSVTISTSINGPSYSIVGSSCTSGVTAGSTCTLQVQFNPVEGGYHDDILTITPNGGVAAPTKVYLKGFEDYDGG